LCGKLLTYESEKEERVEDDAAQGCCCVCVYSDIKFRIQRRTDERSKREGHETAKGEGRFRNRRVIEQKFKRERREKNLKGINKQQQQQKQRKVFLHVAKKQLPAMGKENLSI
jgi:hypothetical protein